MSVRIKTFRIENESAEAALNEYLQNKIVRHWATSYTESSGVWNILVAAEERENNREGGNERGTRVSTRTPRESGSLRESGNAREGGSSRNSDNSGRALRESQGRREPNPARQKAEPHTIDLPDSDMPLYEAMRVWRNSRAREERIKPFTLFNNKQLEEVVKAKPKTDEALRGIIIDMSDEHYQKHKGELLGFIEGAARLDLGSQNLAETMPNRDGGSNDGNTNASGGETKEKAEVNASQDAA